MRRRFSAVAKRILIFFFQARPMRHFSCSGPCKTCSHSHRPGSVMHDTIFRNAFQEWTRTARRLQGHASNGRRTGWALLRSAGPGATSPEYGERSIRNGAIRLAGKKARQGHGQKPEDGNFPGLDNLPGDGEISLSLNKTRQKYPPGKPARESRQEDPCR